jgi:bacterioferritin-associated ferredoxin
MMQDLIICRCEGVRLAEIQQSIREGARAIAGVKKRTRVGMGYCQGRVCQHVVSELLAQATGKPAGTLLQRAQLPVRPTLLGDLLAPDNRDSAT